MTPAKSVRLSLTSVLCLLAAPATACATPRPAAQAAPPAAQATPPAAQATPPAAPRRRGPPQKDMAVDAATRARVVDALVRELRERYVFPAKAEQLEGLLRGKLRAGAYDGVQGAEALAAALTRDMREAVQDGHLHVAYSEEPVPEPRASTEPSPEQLAQMRAGVARLNAGFERVERLPFNIGYLDLRGFAPADLAAPKLAAAMTLLADTRCLVIDLRRNGGGEPEAVAQLASYFFDERTHLNDIFWREGERTVEFWTRPEAAKPRYGAQRKVYVLTSSDTFSAAEDFTYAMKNLGRATVVGETTGGGAHPGDMRRLDAHFSAFIPMGRSISPVTHTDWEGVGVAPDVKAAAKDALNVAQTLFLEERLASEKDPGMLEGLRARLQELR